MLGLVETEAEIALLRRRLARSEAARAEAERLLEDKSRILADANQELRDNRELLRIELGQKARQLLDAQRVAGFGTLVWDADLSRGELSPHCQTLLGIPGLAVIDNVAPILTRVVPEEHQRVIDWANSVTRAARKSDSRHPRAAESSSSIESAGACPEVGKMLEMRIIGDHADQPNRLVRVLAETVRDENIDHMLVYLTVQDITREVQVANEAEALRQRDQRRLHDLEALTTELRTARESADAANAAKTRFLAMMSHDIRTPMNGVIGMLSLFDDDGLSESQHETLRLVRESSDNLRILLDDIIDLERAESGKLTLSPMPMNAEVFLRGAVDFWAKAASDKGLVFNLERMAFGWPERGSDWVLADRFRLRQIADNLLSNAVKYTAKGSITIKVGLVAEERVRFEIVDTGPGIPEGRRAELFQDFSQLPSDGIQRGGAGLGLAICKRLVTQMGGEIGINTGEAGAGVCFWIELPWLGSEPRAEGDAEEPMILLHPEGRRPRVLVAEDVPTNRIVAKGLLSKLGCDVELVENGERAVEAVRDGMFDLVLMDMSMPVMDGPTATREIRALPGAVRNIPIAALTAYSRPEELAPMLNAGAMGAINKPIVLKDMYRVLSGICCAKHETG